MKRGCLCSFLGSLFWGCSPSWSLMCHLGWLDRQSRDIVGRHMPFFFISWVLLMFVYTYLRECNSFDRLLCYQFLFFFHCRNAVYVYARMTMGWTSMLFLATTIFIQHALWNGWRWMQHAPFASTIFWRELNKYDGKKTRIPLCICTVETKSRRAMTLFEYLSLFLVIFHFNWPFGAWFFFGPSYIFSCSTFSTSKKGMIFILQMFCVEWNFIWLNQFLAILLFILILENKKLTLLKMLKW